MGRFDVGRFDVGRWTFVVNVGGLEVGRRTLDFGLWDVRVWKLDVGTLGRWDVGTLGRWDVGTLGRWDVGTLGRWMLDVGCWTFWH